MPTSGGDDGERVFPIVDGVSVWLEGLSQNDEYKQWTQQFQDFRALAKEVRTEATGPLAVR